MDCIPEDAMPNAESLPTYPRDAGPPKTTGNLSPQATKKDTANLMRASLSLLSQHPTSINACEGLASWELSSSGLRLAFFPGRLMPKNA